MRIHSIAIAAILTVAVGIVAAVAQNPAKEGKDHAAMNMDGPSAMAKMAGECALACDGCASHCTEMLAQGKKEHLESQKMLLDCATICAAMARVAGGNGPLTSTLAAACAEACRLCAVHCEKMVNDPHMKACAEKCRAMEKACGEVAGKAPGNATGKEHDGH